jgi:hypothetical protein
MAQSWPEMPVWETGSGLSRMVFFTEHRGTRPTMAVLSNQADHLARLGHATRTAVTQLTGIMKYPEASAVLRSGDDSSFPRNPARSPFWPKLPYMVDAIDGAWKITLGAAQSGGNDRRMRVRPFPIDVDVVWDLDLLVERATCLLTGRDDYGNARKELQRLTRNTRPRTAPIRQMRDPFESGSQGWVSTWEPPIPRWSEAGPRTVPGGLPGHGKRR